MIASAQISFTGIFPREYRKSLLDSWANDMNHLSIPYSKEFQIKSIFFDALTYTDWENHGLPHDTLSHENAIFMFQSLKYPLLIDPQLQATQWIKNINYKRNIMVTSLNLRGGL